MTPPERVEMPWPAVREEPVCVEEEGAKLPPCSRVPRMDKMMRRVIEVVRTAAMLECGVSFVRAVQYEW